jgi:hypothetical protein
LAITDLRAINYSNRFLRPAADKLARTYSRMKELNARWDEIGGTDAEKIVALDALIQSTRRLVIRTYRFCRDVIDYWEADRTTWDDLIPNDVNELVFDNADRTGQDPNRPLVTGRDLRRLRSRVDEFVNWLECGTPSDHHFVAQPTLAVTRNFLHDIYNSATTDVYTASEADVLKLTNSRSNELLQEYETDNPGKLGHIYAVSVVNSPVEE